MNKLIHDAHELITKSGVPYTVCGGFAIDLFLNRVNRKHTDFDISVFNEYRNDILSFMFSQGWKIYQHVWDNAEIDHLVAINSVDEERAQKVFCVWAVTTDCTLVTIEPQDEKNGIFSWKMARNEHVNCDFIEICFDERVDDNLLCNKEHNITRPLDKAILHNDRIPYFSPEVGLYFKAAPVYLTWPKTIYDFYHTAHLLDDERRNWLIGALKTTYPDGHEWIDRLVKKSLL